MATRHPSLVAEYRLDGNATDTSGAGLNGTNTDVTFAAGLGSSVGVFDGTNSYVSGITVAPPVLSSSFTLVGWLKPAVLQSIVMGAICSEVAAISNYWAILGTFNNKWSFGLFNGSQNPRAESAANYPIGEWHHVAGVRNTATGRLTLYIDAVPAADVADTIVGIPEYSALNVGAQLNHATQNRKWNGQLGRLRICNAALSVPDIKRDYVGLLPKRNYT